VKLLRRHFPVADSEPLLQRQSFMSTLHRNSFARALGAAALLIFSGLFSSANGQTGQVGLSQMKRLAIHNPAFLEAAAFAPSFAGFFFSSPESDTLVVAVADMSEAEAARGAVLRILARKRSSPPFKVLTVRKANYSLLELYRWLELVEHKLEGFPQVTASGVNEGSNTITVGVQPKGSTDRVVAVMREARIPKDAYTLETIGRARAEAPLIFDGSPP
jgi:hypothetical protein